MKTTRRKYTPEYKLRALDLMNELGATQAAEKLGLNDSTLYNWKKSFLKKGENAFPGNGKLPADEEKVRALERENRRLREDLEILKKAAAFFAQHSR